MKGETLDNIYDQAFIDTGEGEVIILLHGLFGNLSNWYAVVEYFKKDHRVIIPRLPIFDAPREQANLDYLLTILDAFVEARHLKDITLVGNSLGGHLALLYALKNPSNVKRIVLTGSSGLFENSIGKTFPRIKDYQFIQKKVSETFYKKEVATKELVDEVYEAVQSSTKTVRIIGMAKSAQRNNLTELLHKIDIPVLLIWGIQDSITPPEVGLHFYDLLPNAEIKFIDHCGHVAMMEHPEVFNRHMREFINKY